VTAVKHLFHAAHNCHPWQDAPPAPSWRLFHKHSTTAALSIPTELSIHNRKSTAKGQSHS